MYSIKRLLAGSTMALAIASSFLIACSRDDGESATAVAPAVQVGLGAADDAVAELLRKLAAAAHAKPDVAASWGELGMAQEVNGFVDAALASYRQAATLDSGEPRWPYYQALLLAGRGELEGALDHMATALDLDADHAPAWLWRGTWLLDLDKPNEAAEAFATAATLGAGVPAAVGAARVLLRQGRPAEAVAILEDLSADHSHSYLFKLLAAAYVRLGETDQARLALEKVEDVGPLRWSDARSEAKTAYEASVSVRLAEVRQALAAGEPDRAVAIATPLYRRYPNHQGLLGALSEAYRQLGRPEQMLAVLKRAVAAHPDSYSFHLQLAEHFIASGAGARAVQHLDRVIELNPTVAWAHAQKGLLLLDQNRLDEAMAYFRAAIREDPNQAQSHYYAGMVAASRQRWPLAIDFFSDAVRVDPKFTLAHLGLGRSLAEAGRYDQAQVALAHAERLGSHPEEVQAALASVGQRRNGSG